MKNRHSIKQKKLYAVLIFSLLVFFSNIVGKAYAENISDVAKLPPIYPSPVTPLRGAQLFEHDWSDSNLSNWNYISKFPESGGNVFRIFITPFADGKALLPGQSLTLRLVESLKRYNEVIEWALSKKIYVILAFNPYYSWPPPAANWPDDGRSLWLDTSAQDELIEAWEYLANLYAGKNGIIFDLINEPHGDTNEEKLIERSVWNSLHQRITDAIQVIDPTRWVMISPIWGDAEYFVDLAVNNSAKVIYSFHFYNPHFFTHQGNGSNPAAGTVVYPGYTQDASWDPVRYWDKNVLEEKLQPAITFRDTNNVRVICAEYGSSFSAPESSRHRWVEDLLGLLEDNYLGHIYFLFEGIPSTSQSGWSYESTSFESIVTKILAKNHQAVIIPPEPGTFSLAPFFILLKD